MPPLLRTKEGIGATPNRHHPQTSGTHAPNSRKQDKVVENDGNYSISSSTTKACGKTSRTQSGCSAAIYSAYEMLQGRENPQVVR